MIRFERTWVLVLWLAVPVLVALWWRACRIVRAASAHYGAQAGRRNEVRGVLRLLALAALIAAAAGPYWVRPGAGAGEAACVVFVLDASASMLARDVEPDRLAAAKDTVRDALARLKGDAAALVAASSAPAVVCPPTTDHQAFLVLLDKLDAEWASGSGTQLGPALLRAGDVLENAGSGVVVLLSDGEDHGPPAEKAVRDLRRLGFVTHCICIGREAPAPVFEPTLKGGPAPKLDAAGKPVMSRARPEALAALAEAGGGRFWSVSPSGADLPTSRADLVASADPAVLASRGAAVNLLPWLCLLAVAFMAADLLAGARRISG